MDCFPCACFDSRQNEEALRTFLLSRNAAWDGIVIFYHGIGGGPYPGYIITPNTPFQLNASPEETIGFYFTYSVPEGGERNSLAENTSYTLGTCGEGVETDPVIAKSNWMETYFSAAELADQQLEQSLWGDFADADADGIINLIEFTSGDNPLLASVAPVRWIIDPLTGQWRIRYARKAGLPGNYGQLQWSQDFTTWSNSGIQQVPVSLQNGTELIEARIEYLESNPSVPIYVRLTSAP